jgi:hypothetical protein
LDEHGWLRDGKLCRAGNAGQEKGSLTVFKKTLALGLLICAAGAYATFAVASGSLNDRFSASLNRGQEAPKPKGVSLLATGRFTATLSGKKLKWTLTFKRLTGSATAAHIHSGKRGKAGPVIVPLCGPCKSGMSGTAVVATAVINAIKKGDAYVNVHTAKNKGGEIRGQIRG